MVFSRIATSKNHIELLVPGQMILSKFWSRYVYDLQNFRKLNFLGDDQGELSKDTVSYNMYSCILYPCLYHGVYYETTLPTTSLVRI
jgi:hypothetical protein